MLGMCLTCSLIDFRSKVQSLATLSTAEAELIAIRDGTRELLGTLPLLEALLGATRLRWSVHSDSQAAIGAIRGGVKRTSMKHLKKAYDVSLHWIKDQVGDRLHHIARAANHSDIFTKSLPIEQFNYHDFNFHAA